ncbi:MAG: hypothetical protein AAGC81_11800 [Pseudomonadota bacterium]
MKRKVVQQTNELVLAKKRRRSPLSPFARSSAMLSMKRTAAEPVAVSDLFWEDMRPPAPETWLPGKLTALIGASTPQARVSRPRPYDIDGKAIFVDEHDAPFVLLASGEQVYVHIFRTHLAGDEVLLTMPDSNPQKRYIPPEERARRALSDLALEMRNRKLLAG